jgi:hypothetical protein
MSFRFEVDLASAQPESQGVSDYVMGAIVSQDAFRAFFLRQLPENLKSVTDVNFEPTQSLETPFVIAVSGNASEEAKAALEALCTPKFLLDTIVAWQNEPEEE